MNSFRDPSICGCNDPNGCYNTKLIIPFAVPNKIQSKVMLFLNFIFNRKTLFLNIFLIAFVGGIFLSFYERFKLFISFANYWSNFFISSYVFS